MKRTPLTRSTRLRPRNPKRKAEEFARAYGGAERAAWMKAQPCCVCGYPVSENAHYDTGGMGRKADADHIVPLCRAHHRELHQQGIATFELSYGISLASVAVNTDLAWRHR